MTVPITLRRRQAFDDSELETGVACLGFEEIKLLFVLGPAGGGGNLILVVADGELMVINSNDVVHDARAYECVCQS